MEGPLDPFLILAGVVCLTTIVVVLATLKWVRVNRSRPPSAGDQAERNDEQRSNADNNDRLRYKPRRMRYCPSCGARFEDTLTTECDRCGALFG